jgi:hypothetical protein
VRRGRDLARVGCDGRRRLLTNWFAGLSHAGCEQREQLIERHCGLDVHQNTMAACMWVPGPDREPHEVVRPFGTTPHELLVRHDWLPGTGALHVAMESTGIYWKPADYVLEAPARGATHTRGQLPSAPQWPYAPRPRP